MESLLIYLLKASALLAIFYLSYLFLLKKETTFELNRKYLLLSVVTAGVLPAIYLTRKIYVEASPQSFNFITNDTVSQTPTEVPIDWWQIAGIIYLIITGLFILRLCFQLSAVVRIIASQKVQKVSGFKYLKTTKNQLPFSFFNFIIFNPDKHSEKDLELILEHEKVHAKQFHSIDILLVNLVCCILWFNPFAWLFKKLVEQNLEFIADRETVTHKAEIKEYQHVLVKVSITNLKPALTNQFYQSFIKKRILMLNKKSSSQNPAWKLGLLMPLLLVFMLVFNVNTEAQVKNSAQIKGSASTDDIKTEISVTITSNTTEESLAKFSKFFKKQNVILEFNDIERSRDGDLTNIRVRFQDQEIGNEGEITKNDPNGIESFVIFQNSKKGTGFREANAFDTRAMVNENGNIISQIGTSPLYIINEKEYTAESLHNKHVGFEGSLEALAPKFAIKKYGKKGEDGVIIIKNGKIIENFSEELKKIDSNSKDLMQNFLEINPDYAKPVLISLNKKSDKKTSATYKKSESLKEPVSVEVTGTGYHIEEPEEIKQSFSKKDIIGFQSHKPSSKKTPGLTRKNESHMGNPDYFVQVKPLYVLDGEVQDKEFDVKSLNPENISKINVLKDRSATEKYGDKAKDGVIEIFTKSFVGDTSSSANKDLYVLHNDQDDASIENLKQMIKSGSNIETEFLNITRNSKNEIVSVSISAKAKDGRTASASFQNSEGIPHVIIGFSKDGKLIVSSNYRE